jgi:hypothetical protein
VIGERRSQRAIGELRQVTDPGGGNVLVVVGLRADSEISTTDLGLLRLRVWERRTRPSGCITLHFNRLL